MMPPYAAGDIVAVFDRALGRWCVAAVLSVKSGRLVVATREWWGVISTRRSCVRPIRIVEASA